MRLGLLALRFGDVVATFQCGFTANVNQIGVIGSEGVLLVPQGFVNPPGVVLLDGPGPRPRRAAAFGRERA